MTRRRSEAFKLLVGTRLVTTDGFEVIAYPTDRNAYGRLCRLLTQGNRKAKKGDCHLGFDDILATTEGQMLIALPSDELAPAFPSGLRHWRKPRRSACFSLARTAIAAMNRAGFASSTELGQSTRAPLVAVNDVHYHVPERRQLADIVTCIREKCTIAESGFSARGQCRAHLKPPAEMARCLRLPRCDRPNREIADACPFSLGQLRTNIPTSRCRPARRRSSISNIWPGQGRRNAIHKTNIRRGFKGGQGGHYRGACTHR